MREPQDKSIEGLLVSVQPLPAMRALKLGHKIGKAAFPALAKALADGGGFKMESLAEGAEMLFDRLSEEDLVTITKQLLEMAWITDTDGNKRPAQGYVDLELAGRVSTLVKIIGFALEVNYGDFLAVLKSARAKVEASVSKSPPPLPKSGPATA
jgi:hypothetical protein